MKNTFFIAIMLFSSLVFAYKEVSMYSPPLVSGKYYIIAPDAMYQNIGDDLGFNTWDRSYPYYDIACYISNRRYLYDDDRCSKFGSNCYEYTLDCSVSKRTQFYDDDVKYTDLRGYRTDGTLRWSRDRAGSTDIYCYDKNGMNVIKRVNNPKYCN